MSWTLERSWKLEATPARIFEALTERAQLTRWFAEHVDVQPVAGGSYRFWGKHTLETPDATGAKQRLVQCTPVDGLSYTWSIGNTPTEVAMSLVADGDITRLALNHRIDGELPYPRQLELVDDYWKLAFGNLAEHLKGGDGIVLPDFSDPEPAVRQTILIDAPPSVVFRALTEPALINQWFGTSKSEVEPRIGGRYSVGWQYTHDGRDVAGGPTRILAFEQDRRLVLDWPDWRGDATNSGQTISFELEPVGDKTRLQFVHAGFSRTADIGDYPFGWTYFLDGLQQVSAKATMPPAEASR